MLNTSTAVPHPAQLPSLSGDLLPAVILIGIAGLLVVLYLCLDGLNTRRETRRLARKRQLAREAWQQEQSDLH